MKVLNQLDMSSQRIISLADPSSATDAATKQYVDGLVNGLSWKASVRAATTTNGTLATAYANGQVIDGVTLATGNRILLKNQSTGAENGIYIVAASGAPTRATDMDASAEAVNNTTVLVNEGTTLADTAWTLSNNGAITLGTTALTFVQVGGGTAVVAGGGLTGTSTFAVGAGTGIVVNADDVQIDTSIVVRKYAVSVGNGAATSIGVTHNLGTKDVQVAVRDSATDAWVLVDWVATDTNTVTLTFAVAPASNAYRCVVQG